MGARLFGRNSGRGRSAHGRRQSISARRGGGIPRSAARHLQAVIQFHLLWTGEGGDGYSVNLNRRALMKLAGVTVAGVVLVVVERRGRCGCGGGGGLKGM